MSKEQKRKININWNSLIATLTAPIKEVKGMVFITYNTRETILYEIQRLCKGKFAHPSRCERFLNHEHLKLICRDKETQKSIAEVIKAVWLVRLKEKFPGERFKIPIWVYEHEVVISLYKVRGRKRSQNK
jgi:hypothetical protein